MSYERILIAGPFGQGKTSQVFTLPGLKKVYAFDPNAIACLKHCPNTQIISCLPEADETDVRPRHMKVHVSSIDRLKPQAYDRFLKDVDSTDWSCYDWLVIDGISFLARAMMLPVKILQQRNACVDGRTNYLIVGNMLVDLFTYLPNLPVNLLATCHYKLEDEEKAAILDAPGSACRDLPKEFNQIWSCFQKAPDKSGAGSTYHIQTAPDEKLPICRSSIKPALDFQYDVTIDFSSFEEEHLSNQGIGKLLKPHLQLNTGK